MLVKNNHFPEFISLILYSLIGFNNNFDVDKPLYCDIMSRYGKTTPTPNRLQFKK